MVLNPFFTQGTSAEQNLVQDLINEQLRTYGVEIFYIPRKFITEKSVIREVVQSKFDMALPLEAYIDNYDQYSGAGNLLSKFGIESRDEVRLVISRERYENYISPLIEDQANIKLSTRPKSGDLIWFPLDDRIYEIKDIEYAKPYYQLQDLYTYELTCELFRYEDEVLATGIDEIDNNLVGDDPDGTTEDGISTIQGVTHTLTLVGTGVTATAVTGIITSGGIRFINVTNRGGGYGEIPTVAISSAPSTGITGIATATMIGGINVCNLNANPRLQSVQTVPITNPGAGYTVAPKIKFYGGKGGTGAAATSGIADGTVGIITVSSGGSGYTTAPTVTIDNPGGAVASASTTGVGGSITVSLTNVGIYYTIAPTVTISSPVGVGTTATATATIGTSGTVTAINLTNVGAGYTQNPTVTISNELSTKDRTKVAAASVVAVLNSAGVVSQIKIINAGLGYSTSPSITVSSPDMDSTGDFIFNEIVTGQTSGTTARVRTWNSSTNVLEVASVSGAFTIGEDVVGSTSGASHALRVIDTTPDNDPFADNFEIETQADSILDFSEQNPFGIP